MTVGSLIATLSAEVNLVIILQGGKGTKEIFRGNGFYEAGYRQELFCYTVGCIHIDGDALEVIVH